MNQPEIQLYIGKIQQWTSDLLECKNRESICGRRLLAYGLWERYRKDLPGDIQGADELYACLEEMIVKGIHGKPYFREIPQIHFNISHSGAYGHVPFLLFPAVWIFRKYAEYEADVCWSVFYRKKK